MSDLYALLLVCSEIVETECLYTLSLRSISLLIPVLQNESEVLLQMLASFRIEQRPSSDTEYDPLSGIVGLFLEIGGSRA